MRVASGKGNDARKILTYYRVNYSLRPPYRVLCDGALIHTALSKKLHLRDALPALLKETATAVVTRCVQEELRALGAPTEAAADFARRLMRVPCAHGDAVVPAAECVAAALSGGNPRGYVAATNDAGLLRGLRREPGVPVVRLAADGRFVLVPPGRVTREEVGEMEARKSGVQRPDEVRKLEEEARARAVMKAERRAARAAKKRKRAKEPNPLSVKKSKKEKTQAAPRPHGEEEETREGAGGDAAAPAPDAGSGAGAEDAEGGLDGALTDEAQPPEKSEPKRVRKRKPKVRAPVPEETGAPAGSDLDALTAPRADGGDAADAVVDSAVAPEGRPAAAQASGPPMPDISSDEADSSA